MHVVTNSRRVTYVPYLSSIVFQFKTIQDEMFILNPLFEMNLLAAAVKMTL